MKKRPLQTFTREYLKRCAEMTPDQVIEFLENYRLLVCNQKEKCQLISMKIEPSLLDAFKQKARLFNISYQTQIKALMRAWIEQ